MKKLRTGGLIAIICVVGMGIVLGARSAGTVAVSRASATSARPESTVTDTVTTTSDVANSQPTPVPDKVVYGLFFRQIAAVSAKADEVERNGGDARPLRKHFAKIAALNDTESELLDRVVADYIREAGLITARQKVIADAFRAKYPDGRIPKGEISERPPSFHEFTLEREQLYLRMRDQLETLLGPQSFARLDAILRSKLTANAQVTIGTQTLSATPETEQEKP